MCAGDENALDVKEETVTLAARFYPLGIALGLPSSKLDKIRQDYPRDCDGALSQVIIAWLKRSYDVSKHGHPSWKKLVGAVASEAGGQNPALAQRIAAAHRGKVTSITYIFLGSLDRWIVFTASRKRQQSNDEGVPRPKQPHIEDGEEIVHGSREEWAVACKLSHFVCEFNSCSSCIHSYCVNLITSYIASMKCLKLKNCSTSHFPICSCAYQCHCAVSPSYE